MSNETQSAVLLQARHHYQRILGQAMGPSQFYARLAVILDANPYFMPAYLEMLWYAEERNDSHLYERIRELSLRAVKKVFASKKLRQKLSESWTKLEVDALGEILDVLKVHPQNSILDAFLLRIYRVVANEVITPKTIVSPFEPRHLTLKMRTDITGLRKEVDSLAAYWWQVNGVNHEAMGRHAWTVELRTREGNDFKNSDTWHRSVPSGISKRFPIIHEEVLRLANELKIGLERVVLVMMLPRIRSCWFYETGLSLAGGDRYYLVLQCGDNNVLASGPEVVVAKEGDLWFFDNKAMYRVDNRSSIPCIYVSIEGYPLNEL